MGAYYNEIDPFAAEWLRNLIVMGEIAPGIVDERSIEDVSPDDLREFTQCHFFAGIGVWSLSLRRAGWPDDRPIWTGSCPCQPFSASGKRTGFADERHLWPSWEWLVRECRPAVIVGEQVASKATEPWFDLVQADLEALDYSFGCIPFPSASVGAPHIRDRAYWVGHSNNPRLERFTGDGSAAGRQGQGRPVTETGLSGGLADASRIGERTFNGQPRPGIRQEKSNRGHGVLGGLADHPSDGRRKERQDAGGQLAGNRAKGRCSGLSPGGSDNRTGPVNGFWRDADWLFCRDGKWRPVEPGTFPLAHGAPARVGRLRAYGNAINAEAATVFIETVMEAFELNYN